VVLPGAGIRSAAEAAFVKQLSIFAVIRASSVLLIQPNVKVVLN